MPPFPKQSVRQPMRLQALPPQRPALQQRLPAMAVGSGAVEAALGAAAVLAQVPQSRRPCNGGHGRGEIAQVGSLHTGGLTLLLLQRSLAEGPHRQPLAAFRPQPLRQAPSECGRHDHRVSRRHVRDHGPGGPSKGEPKRRIQTERPQRAHAHHFPKITRMRYWVIISFFLLNSPQFAMEEEGASALVYCQVIGCGMRHKSSREGYSRHRRDCAGIVREDRPSKRQSRNSGGGAEEVDGMPEGGEGAGAAEDDGVGARGGATEEGGNGDVPGNGAGADALPPHPPHDGVGGDLPDGGGGGGGAVHGNADVEAFDALPAAGWGGDVAGGADAWGVAEGGAALLDAALPDMEALVEDVAGGGAVGVGDANGDAAGGGGDADGGALLLGGVVNNGDAGAHVRTLGRPFSRTLTRLQSTSNS